MEKIERLSVRYGRGRDTYRVRLLVEGLTNDEIIDLCDASNWGGCVYRYADNICEVTVYTD